MSKTITIVGYEPETHCDHCGRALQHGVRTDLLGTVGADCIVKMVQADRKKFSGNGKPTSSWIRDLAKKRERYSNEGLSRFGLGPHHFVFGLSA